MGGNDDVLWALVAGSLLLLAHVGVVLLIEGLTRRRSVNSGIARHLGSAGAATLGVVIVGFGIAFGDGNRWIGTHGGALFGVDLDAAIGVGAGTNGSTMFVQIAAAVLVSAIALGATAERATVMTHVVVGVLIGGLAVPILWRGLAPEGLLGSISLGERVYLDAGAGAVFSIAGWFALVGALVIGPRRGRVGPSGEMRAYPGKSLPMAAAGALLFVIGASGVVAVPYAVWTDGVASGALAIVIGSASGALVAGGIGRWASGAVGTTSMVRGFLAGTVAVSGNVEVSPLEAMVLGAVAAIVVGLVVSLVERATIDDPVGVIAIFAAGGVWASIAAAGFDAEQLFAQIIGQLIIAAWSVTSAGVIFGALRVIRVLRLSVELEIVGLDR